MRRLAYVTLIVLVAACALSFVRSAAATAACPDPWVKTYTLGNVETSTFAPGEKVNLKAHADTDFTIIVIRPGSPPTQWTIKGPTGGGDFSQVYDNLTNQMGWWTLVLFDTSYEFAVGYFNVIPFAPLGAVAALGACFVGAGIKLRKKD